MATRARVFVAMRRSSDRRRAERRGVRCASARVGLHGWFAPPTPASVAKGGDHSAPAWLRMRVYDCRASRARRVASDDACASSNVARARRGVQEVRTCMMFTHAPIRILCRFIFHTASTKSRVASQTSSPSPFRASQPAMSVGASRFRAARPRRRRLRKERLRRSRASASAMKASVRPRVKTRRRR